MTSRRQIQDGGPHDFRSKMAAPTTPRWRPHEVRYEMAAPVTRSVTLSRLFPRTDRLRNWVVKAEMDMIVYQRRTGSSPCIWRRANLGVYCVIICCMSFSILMNSSPKLLSYALRPLYYPLLFRLSSDFAISKAWATGVTRFTMGFSFCLISFNSLYFRPLPTI